MKDFTRPDALKMAGGTLLAAGTLGMPSIARAAYPDRPINIIVPFATGGYNDRLARAFAPYLEKELGQAFKSIALRWLRRQPRMKSAKLEDITKMTRYTTREGKVGFKIEARGKTFTLRVKPA